MCHCLRPYLHFSYVFFGIYSVILRLATFFDFVLLALVENQMRKTLKRSFLLYMDLVVCECCFFVIGFWFTIHKFTHVFVAIQLFEASLKTHARTISEQSEGHRSNGLQASKDFVICFDFVKFARLEIFRFFFHSLRLSFAFCYRQRPFVVRVFSCLFFKSEKNEECVCSPR